MFKSRVYNKDVIANGIQPGWKDTLKLSIRNQSNKTLVYSIKFSEVYNDFNPTSEFVYRVKRDGITIIGETPSPTSDAYILQSVLIPANTTYEYEIEYEFIETGYLQNYQMGKNFRARIVVEAN